MTSATMPFRYVLSSGLWVFRSPPTAETRCCPGNTLDHMSRSRTGYSMRSHSMPSIAGFASGAVSSQLRSLARICSSTKPPKSKLAFPGVLVHARRSALIPNGCASSGRRSPTRTSVAGTPESPVQERPARHLSGCRPVSANQSSVLQSLFADRCAAYVTRQVGHRGRECYLDPFGTSLVAAAVDEQRFLHLLAPRLGGRAVGGCA